MQAFVTVMDVGTRQRTTSWRRGWDTRKSSEGLRFLGFLRPSVWGNVVGRQGSPAHGQHDREASAQVVCGARRTTTVAGQEVGRKRFVKSLEVDSRTVALRRAVPIIAAWRAQIEAARGKPETDMSFWRRALAQAETPGQRGAILDATGPDTSAALWRDLLRSAPPERRAAILHAIEIEAEQIGAVNVEPGQLPSGDPEARDFYQKATGSVVGFLDHMDEWLRHAELADKTKHMAAHDLRRFARKFAHVRDVTRPAVQRWASVMITDEGIAPKTMQRILPALRGYWRYLQTIAAAPEDGEPFSKLQLPRGGDPGARRRAFEAKDVTRLWKEAIKRGDQELADVIDVGRYSGMRIEEIASLRIERNGPDFFKIEDAKTPAGWREIPIHPRLKATVQRLAGDRKAGYLLAHLSVNKFGDRSNAVGKRFGRLKKELGYDRTLVFHSVRKLAATMLQNAGVIEATAAELLGHDKGAGPLSYGLYSAGASLAVKRAAIEKLRYPV